MHLWNKGKWVFRDVDNLGYPYHHIHPYKQDVVKHIVEHKPDWVQMIIVFGSAVQPWHFYEKDVDLCIIGKNPDIAVDKTIFVPASSRLKIDVLIYENINELEDHDGDINSVRYAILRDGICVYGK